MRGKHVAKPSKKKKLLTWSVAAVLTLIVLVLLLKGCGVDIAGTQTQQSAPVEQNPDSIAIPGYEALELKADTLQQTLCLSNPAQNMCYFCIELYLEDGTLLWRSELVEPGEASKPIVLTQALAKGNYTNAVLRYSCFKMDGTLAPLNGAETKLTLWVK